MSNTIRRFGSRLSICTATLVFIVAAAIAMVPAKKVSAADGCTDGDRNFAASLASSGNFVEAFSLWTDSAKLTLRYSSDSGCAWGLLSDGPDSYVVGLQTGKVWVDRSWDGGAHWNKYGEIGTGTNRSTYTGAYHMVNSNAIRACSVTITNGGGFDTGKPPKSVNTPTSGPVYCTAWFFPSRLMPNQTMGGRGFSSLSSQNNRYVLRMQGDGNLVLYSFGRAVWATNTFAAGSILKMQDDGNLVVIAPGNRPVWASNSSGTNNRNSVLMVQDDGNVVIVAPGNRPIWATGTNGR